MQATAGAAEVLDPLAARILKSHLIEQHRAFFPQLPFVVVAVVDRQGHPWASLLFGEPGFAWSPDPALLRIDRHPNPADPIAAEIFVGAPVGLLGIELPTRRRNRLNGVVTQVDAKGFEVSVEQSFGNCPQYIQRRVQMNERLEGKPDPQVSSFGGLDDEAARRLLATCDTFFVASFAVDGDGRPGVDVSHRGGKPGFVLVQDDEVLKIPDFSGNRYFNTLGNVLLTERAGLVVPSFQTGDLLLLTGSAEVGVTESDIADAKGIGAERLWRVKPVNGLWLRNAFAPALILTEWSPQTLATGVWAQASTWESRNV